VNRRAIPFLAAGALLASCSAMRMAYDNADTALRFMASSYLDLDSTQAEDMKQRIVRFHEWHRKSELPAYAALMRSATERAARGITAEDVAWGLASVRARYRSFAVKAVEDAAPVLVTLSPEQIGVLERANVKFEFPVNWGVDLQSEHERYLTEKYAKKPVIVMNYPKAIKAFYMRLNDDGKTVAAMDVLAPGIGEIIGGSQREERLDVLDARMSESGLDKERYGWYRDLRRYGTVPHAGFGLGFERTVAYVTGLANVRDAIPFPRTPGNAKY